MIVLEKLNIALNYKKIYFKILCQCPNRILVLVYRQDLLSSHLKNAAIANYLAANYYSATNSLEKTLSILAKRIINNPSFPHEIGIFLGYPLSDVLGFLKYKGQNYKASGYWKVYANEQTTLNLFKRYNQCTTSICTKLEKGFSLIDLFKTA